MHPTPQSDSRAPLDEVGALLCRVAGLLYVNGQTTRNMVERVERLAHALGYSAECFPNWGEIVIRIAQSGESHAQKILLVAGSPVGVDMNKVMKTVEVLDRVSTGGLDVRGAAAALKEIARLAATSTLRFAALAGAGARRKEMGGRPAPGIRSAPERAKRARFIPVVNPSANDRRATNSG